MCSQLSKELGIIISNTLLPEKFIQLKKGNGLLLRYDFFTTTLLPSSGTLPSIFHKKSFLIIIKKWD